MTINPSVETSVLIPKSTTSPSKKCKDSKKEVKGSLLKPSLTPLEKVVKPTPNKVIKNDKPLNVVNQPVVKETSTPAKDVVPSKSGVLKRLKKMDHRPRLSPERSHLSSLASLNLIEKGLSFEKFQLRYLVHRKIEEHKIW